MGNILAHFFLPHPPAAIPQVGGRTTEKLNNTVTALQEAAKSIASLKPDTIVIISSHGPCLSDQFYMPSQERISGDFSAFGCKKLILGFDNDIPLAKTISNHAKNSGLNAGFIDDLTMKQLRIPYDLDHGITVPLWFIRQQYDGFKVVPICTSGKNGKDHYRFGILLREAILQSNCNAVVIASGDLSHRLSEENPSGYDEAGELFDKSIRKMLLAEDPKGFLTIDPKVKEKAEQCALDAYRVVLGTLDGFAFIPRILSYEAPTGIGYLAAELNRGKPKESAFTRFLVEEDLRHEERKAQAPIPIRLAETAIENYLNGEKDFEVPQNLPTELTQNQSGVFVTITNDGQLRGCRGSIRATHPTLAEEIMNSAVCAAKDPLFAPIRPTELKDLTITVDILDEPEEVTDRNDLDPKTYGIIVENRGKIAVMLPNEIGIETVEDQIKTARAKAGIHPWHRLKIQRFTTTRYE